MCDRRRLDDDNCGVRLQARGGSLLMDQAYAEARGDPRSRRNARYVRVVNQVRNGSPIVRRRDAEALVAHGRAEWIGQDQVRLIVAHPLNKAEAAAAAEHYHGAVNRTVRSVAELRHIPLAGDPWKLLMRP